MLNKAIKNFKLNKNSKLESGNILDIFIRRCLLYLGKCGFNDLVVMHNSF